jgi:hypothetical protein
VAAAQVYLSKYARWTVSDRIQNNMVRLYAELAGVISASTPPAEIAAGRADYYRIEGIR